MGLYQKYRPQNFDQVIGNEQVTTSLQSVVKSKDCPHSFLMTGDTGCGKTTVARIIAKELGCKGSDYKEIDTADLRGIETVREMIRNSRYAPIEGNVRVWVIDECHKMTNDAQNALLKLLEDTPNHVYIVLCTTDPQKLLKTIKGRCSTYAMKPLTDVQMRKLLHHIVKAEGDKISKSIYDQIIRDSLGLPRNAIQILEQVLSAEPDNRINIAQKSAEQFSQSIELCRALIQGHNWKKVKNILNGLKNEDPESIRRHVLGYCQSVLLNDSNEQAASVIEEFWEPLYNIGFPGLVYSCYCVISK